ncbi:NAD(P)/FAD-dependent oxidoreductase [Thiomicrorhabdus sp. ZW0627]|uniref:NAD(P)/FAD-dependent oxidoreductase n=1 Tax=Thiomicrorhabdus sp. ZW0627 TaxID=3039774 RepID=UPI002436E9FF|nr:NAD(P)/FAD-dependent oxidoreductase [Thiomicrorhabdus sp. ZW0627]MDG6773258.1 NAD(P)/FAD-dependent oxidoreductase [Thiomicrorhabdus sp. ZW0627]
MIQPECTKCPDILIVGGGAGGLELATQLGHSLGKKQLARITLVDPNRVHLWKPLLHEVASGSLDTGREALSYRAHSAENHYYFRLGAFKSLDKSAQTITLAPFIDHHGKQLLDERTLPYDYLVIAIGAKCNDFGLEGVQENCFTLDTSQDAEDFHLSFLNRFLQYSEESQKNDQVCITIVGGGATGVELAAELYNAVDRLEQFGIHRIHHQSLNIALIEATDRILPFMPENISEKAQRTLTEQGVTIHTNTVVKGVTANRLTTEDDTYEADLIVWAAGVKAPKFLAELDLPTNRINQIEITPTLQVKGEENIYAIGDCSVLLDEVTSRPMIPATAQAAHQMAETCGRNIEAQINRTPLETFQFHDHGTLISLSRFQTLGSLLDELFHKNWKVEGKVAQWIYASMYRQHQLAIHGAWKTFWIMLTGFIEKRVKPKLKLY